MRFKSTDPELKGSALRWLTLAVIPIVALAVLVLTSPVTNAQTSGKRVIVLGFDGMDFNLVSRYLAEGKLPNLQRLREKGVFSSIMSSNPAESPVAWSTFVTGTNPGKTGIFDFLRRNPDTYFPELNMTDIVMDPRFLFETVPIAAPVLRNCRQGRAFWGYAADAGVPTTAIMMPMNMPPDEAQGSRVLSGLGVPDIRRTMGTYVFYVDDISVAERATGSTGGTEMGGRVIQVERSGDEITTFLPGPFNPLKPGTGDELTVPVKMKVSQADRTVEFTLLNGIPFKFMLFFGGMLIALVASLIIWPVFRYILKSPLKGFLVGLAIFLVAVLALWIVSRPVLSPRIATLKEGEWSDWIPVTYRITNWVPATGFFRVFLLETEPEFRVYVTPVSIDPRGMRASISYPTSFATDLLGQYGEFKTYGWDSETWALNENVIDERTYLDDALGNFDQKADMVLDQMKLGGWTIFASVFQLTDHVSHMFWRFLDPEAPMYDAQLAEEFGDGVLSAYQRADTLVGSVMDEVLDEDDTLIVMSDHGFNSFNYSVNVNRWLVDNGYLAEKGGPGGSSSVYELFSPGSQFFQWVDWSKSRAYALGLGQIYINLEGREKQGIVTENEKSALIDEIIAGLKNLTDPTTGEKVLINVYRADKIYQGDNMKYAPDIVLGFTPGYRVSWQTTLGVAAEDLIEMNNRKWSGDHCSFDPTATLGILFCNVPITEPDPGVIDMAPSILKLVGVAKPDRCDGRVIF